MRQPARAGGFITIGKPTSSMNRHASFDACTEMMDDSGRAIVMRAG